MPHITVGDSKPRTNQTEHKNKRYEIEDQFKIYNS